MGPIGGSMGGSRGGFDAKVHSRDLGLGQKRCLWGVLTSLYVKNDAFGGS